MAAVLSAGCSSPSWQSSIPDGSSSTIERHAAAPRSWMSPEAAGKNLLYVSDDSGVVYVLTYPDGKLVGTLTGFDGPAGLCSDANGNVFVANTRGEDILEYAHGGKKPIATLLEFSVFPEGCAVDPVSGELAVTNFATAPSAGPGNVAVYQNARGNPTFYSAKGFNQYLFCGFDSKGNLFIDGVDAGTTTALFAELPHGGSSMKNLTVNQTIGFPGGVQWDGNHVAIEDVTKDNVYRVDFSGSKGTVAGTVHLSVPSHLVVQFWLQGSSIIMPFGSNPRTSKKVGEWAYPAGGSPSGVLHIPGDVELIGATVSLAKP